MLRKSLKPAVQVSGVLGLGCVTVSSHLHAHSHAHAHTHAHRSPFGRAGNLGAEDAKFGFFAVYDGHGGRNAVEYIRDNFHR